MALPDTTIQQPFRIIKSDADLQIVLGVVYRPDTVDTDREALLKGDHEQMYLQWALSNRFDQIDVQHDFQPCGARVVEFFRARHDEPDLGILKHDWMMAVWVPDPIWAMVCKGELNGFSWGTRIPVERTKLEDIPVAVPIRGTGKTEKRSAGLLAEHDHDIDVSFTKTGDVIPCWTSWNLGHRHLVTGTTATGTTLDHAHPMLFEAIREAA